MGLSVTVIPGSGACAGAKRIESILSKVLLSN
jgi:hypothetical protein